MSDEFPANATQAPANSGEESGESGGELLSSIPEIYFDIIARLVPGGMLVWLYGHEYLSKEVNTLTGVFALLASYLAGVVLHIVSDIVWALPLRGICAIPWLNLAGDGELWLWVRSGLPAQDQKRLTKLMAEKAMFRSASLVPVLVALDGPHKLPEALLAISADHPRRLALITFLLFSLCMLVVTNWLVANEREMMAAREKNNSSVLHQRNQSRRKQASVPIRDIRG